MLVAHFADFAQVFKFAFLVLILARDNLLGVQASEEVMRFDFLAFGKQTGIGTEHFNERMNLSLCGLAQLNQVVALFRWEEVVCVYAGEFCIHAINAANPLNQPCWVPGNVIVDDHVGAMQVHAFGKHFRTNQNPVVVARVERVRVKVSDHGLMRRFVRLP